MEWTVNVNLNFSWQYKTQNCLDKNHNIFQTTCFNHSKIERRRLKNVVIFIQTLNLLLKLVKTC